MERVSEGSGVGVTGRIFIKVDKEQYAPGDLVTGTVFVTIADSIQCKGATRLCVRRPALKYTECVGLLHAHSVVAMLHACARQSSL